MSPEEEKQFDSILADLSSTRKKKSAGYGNSWKFFGLMGIV
jgi:hypothetical protein